MKPGLRFALKLIMLTCVMLPAFLPEAAAARVFVGGDFVVGGPAYYSYPYYYPAPAYYPPYYSYPPYAYAAPAPAYTPPAPAAGNQYCREYTHKVLVDGVWQTAHGNACRQPDGSWKIID